MHHQNSEGLEIGNQYIIPFAGLKIGSHDFTFQLNDEFFIKHETIQSKGGKVKVAIELERKSNLIEIDMQLNGSILVCCDRCLDFFNYKVKFADKLIIKFKDQPTEMLDDVWVLNVNEHEINLYQYFYDIFGIVMPLQVIHPDDKNGVSLCNPEFTKHLGQNNQFNNDEMDPRWAELLKLKQKH